MEILEKVVEELKEKTKKECIRIISEPCEDMTIYQSKFGGVPYIPDNFEYPYSRSHPEQPLKLLAQINFADVPQIEDFKHLKGILQIYINPDDDRWYGCDQVIEEELSYYSSFFRPYSSDKVTDVVKKHYDDLKSFEPQSGCCNEYRIIYHEDVDYSVDNTDKIPEIRYDNNQHYGFIAKQPQKMIFKKEIEYLPYGTINHDDEFDKAFLEIYNKYADEEVDEVEDIEDAQWYIEQNFTSYARHKIGGYRNDIHDAQWDASNKWVLLLQIGSDKYMRWGDDGVAHFEMSRELLKNLGFDKVHYDWSCY